MGVDGLDPVTDVFNRIMRNSLQDLSAKRIISSHIKHYQSTIALLAM